MLSNLRVTQRVDELRPDHSRQAGYDLSLRAPIQQGHLRATGFVSANEEDLAPLVFGPKVPLNLPILRS